MTNVTHHKVHLWVRLRVLVRRHRLQFALGGAIAVAVFLTFISVNIYVLAGFSRYDLSRPGYEKERQEIAKSTPQKTYNTTGTLTAQTIAEFLDEFDERVRDLNAYGDYRDPSLSDDAFGIGNGD